MLFSLITVALLANVISADLTLNNNLGKTLLNGKTHVSSAPLINGLSSPIQFARKHNTQNVVVASNLFNNNLNNLLLNAKTHVSSTPVISNAFAAPISFAGLNSNNVQPDFVNQLLASKVVNSAPTIQYSSLGINSGIAQIGNLGSGNVISRRVISGAPIVQNYVATQPQILPSISYQSAPQIQTNAALLNNVFQAPKIDIANAFQAPTIDITNAFQAPKIDIANAFQAPNVQRYTFIQKPATVNTFTVNQAPALSAPIYSGQSLLGLGLGQQSTLNLGNPNVLIFKPKHQGLSSSVFGSPSALDLGLGGLQSTFNTGYPKIMVIKPKNRKFSTLGSQSIYLDGIQSALPQIPVLNHNYHGLSSAVLGSDSTHNLGTGLLTQFPNTGYNGWSQWSSSIFGTPIFAKFDDGFKTHLGKNELFTNLDLQRKI